MSLINQMLRDLQQQKKDGETAKPDTLSPRKVDHVPYLPLPLVLSGVAVVLLCLVWWLSGVLSDLLFTPELVAKPIAPQEVVATEQPRTIENTMVIAESNQLTKTERAAEPPAVPAVPQQVVNPLSVKESTSASSSASSAARGKQVTASSGVTKTTPPVQSPPVLKKAKVVASSPKRLHPDDLPGAILSSSHNLIEVRSIDTPSRSRAETPYGMAEVAYLDGKQALAQEHNSQAVSFLQQALTHYPGHLQARGLLVEIFGKEGKNGEAMFLLAEGLEIAPDYIVFKKKYARLLMDQGDFGAATKVMLYSGLPTVEVDPEAHVLLASLYQRLGESFLAAQTYRNLLVAWPQTGAFWVGLGSALEGQQLPEEAVICYQRALKTKALRLDLSQYAEARLSLLN